jgi:hypothetical protein
MQVRFHYLRPPETGPLAADPSVSESRRLGYEDRADVRTKLSTLFTVVRPRARHNHPMTVRGFETADGRSVEHGQFGGFLEVGDVEAERQLADVFVGAAVERLLDGARDVSDGGLAALAYRSCCPSTSTGSRRCSATRLCGRWWPCGPAPGWGCASSARPPGVRYTGIGTAGRDALHVGALFDVRLGGLRAVPEATLPVAFER